LSEQEKDTSKSIIILGEPKKTLAEACEVLEKESPHPVETVTDLKDAVDFTRRGKPFLALVSPESPDEIQLAVGFLKASKGLIQKKKAKVIMVTSFDSPPIQQKFQKLGVADYIAEPVALKSLEFKINLQLKSIETDEAESKSKVEFNSQKPERDDDDNGGFSSSKVEFELTEELQGISENVWHFDSKEKPKSVSGKIMLQLRGPDPNAGEWKYLGENRDGVSQWTWVWDGDTVPENMSIDVGQWIFTGNRPVHSAELWKFVSSAPELNFTSAGEVLGCKFKAINNSQIKIAKNSDTTTGLLSKIESLVREKSKMKGGKGARGTGMSLNHMDTDLTESIDYEKADSSVEHEQTHDYSDREKLDEGHGKKALKIKKKGPGLDMSSMFDELGLETAAGASAGDAEELSEADQEAALEEELKKQKEKEAFLKAEKAEKFKKAKKKEKLQRKKERRKNLMLG
jgi:DNA-binding response OmpR family regulator